MIYIILVFAGFMVITGLIILVSPPTVYGVMSTHLKSLQLHLFAVAVRLFLGVVFVAYAGSSKFPVTLAVIGWLFIAAGLILTVMGRNNFQKLVGWAVTLVPRYGRAGGVSAILFGGFLIYAILK